MYLDPSAVFYTEKIIHFLLKCVIVSLDRPQGTRRGVGALGGGERSLFFMLWVKHYACVGWTDNMMNIC